MFVNDLSEPELTRQLALVRHLPIQAAERIVAMRPFNDAADLRRRVNDGAKPKQCIGKKLLVYFHFSDFASVAGVP